MSKSALALLLVVMSTQDVFAACHHYSIWYNPWPQKCKATTYVHKYYRNKAIAYVAPKVTLVITKSHVVSDPTDIERNTPMVVDPFPVYRILDGDYKYALQKQLEEKKMKIINERPN